jgi:3-oxoacyl-[acyl-carrier-protein] synthase-3
MMSEYTFPEMKKLLLENHCKIIAMSEYLPERIVTNKDIINSTGLNVTDQAIRKTIGVEERRVADSGLADTDLMARAAIDCLKKAGISASELSKIIVNKFLGDTLLPMNASMLQAKLECPVAVQSLDVDGGVNSFFQAFDLAAKMINSGDRYILIVSGGIINKFVRTTDARHAFLFGDAATAVLLGPSDKQHLKSSYMFSNYDYVNLSVGMELRQKVQADIHEKKDYSVLYDLYQMEDWTQALPFIHKAMATTSDKLLTAAGLKKDDIDVLVVSEYNKRVRDTIIDAVNIQAKHTISVLNRYGNTLSAMIPLQLNEGYKTGVLTPGTNVMVLSLGEGISGGGFIYQF